MGTVALSLVVPLADNGLKAWQQVLDRGYEGLVGKDESAPYDKDEAHLEPDAADRRFFDEEWGTATPLVGP